MSKPVKEMIIADYQQRFDDVEDALVVDIRGIDANENNDLRLDLQTKDIRITVIKNSLARKAFADTALEALAPVLDGPSALAYGPNSVVDIARELVSWAKKLENLDLKGATLDGMLYEGAAGVKKLSEMPTREEAQARVIQLVLSPAGNIVGAATNPGAKLLGIIKEIQERLEKDQPIQKSA
jgi:large subunit ribosomal protein L10